MFTFFSQGLINLDFWHYSAYLSKPFKFSYIPPPTAYKPHWWGLVYIALPPTSQYQFSLLVTEVIAMTKKKKKKKYLQVQRGTEGFIWSLSLKAESILLRQSRQQKHKGIWSHCIQSQESESKECQCSSFLLFFFSFSLGPYPMDWSHQYSSRMFLLSQTPLVTLIRGMFRDVFLKWF